MLRDRQSGDVTLPGTNPQHHSPVELGRYPAVNYTPPFFQGQISLAFFMSREDRSPRQCSCQFSDVGHATGVQGGVSAEGGERLKKESFQGRIFWKIHPRSCNAKPAHLVPKGFSTNPKLFGNLDNPPIILFKHVRNIGMLALG